MQIVTPASELNGKRATVLRVQPPRKRSARTHYLVRVDGRPTALWYAETELAEESLGMTHEPTMMVSGGGQDDPETRAALEDIRQAALRVLHREAPAHTPGPWFVQGPFADGEANKAGGEPRTIVAEVEGETFDILDDLGEDDARLIAAAPDLLTALDALMRCGPHPRMSEWRDAMALAEAAVARVDGKEQP